MTPERILQIRNTHYPQTTYDLCDEVDALRSSVAALTEEREQVLDILKSSEHETDDTIFAARMRMAQIEGLTERARIAEDERDRLHRVIEHNHKDAMIGHQWFEKQFGEEMNGRDFSIKCPMADARLAAQTEGVPCQECALLKQIQSDYVFSCSRCGKTVINHIPPAPVPEEAPKPDPRASYDREPKPVWACPGYGHWGHNHKTCTGCVDAALRSLRESETAPGQFTARERECFLFGYNDGRGKSWDIRYDLTGNECIDNHMLGYGLKPSPVAERDKVTMDSLQKIYSEIVNAHDVQKDSWPQTQTKVIRAVLAAAQGKEVVE